MALLSLTVNNLSPALDKQSQEVAQIARALDLAAQDIRMNGGVTVLGSWVYVAQASS
jgi:hypothetical protein